MRTKIDAVSCPVTSSSASPLDTSEQCTSELILRDGTIENFVLLPPSPSSDAVSATQHMDMVVNVLGESIVGLTIGIINDVNLMFENILYLL